MKLIGSCSRWLFDRRHEFGPFQYYYNPDPNEDESRDRYEVEFDDREIELSTQGENDRLGNI